MGKITAPYGIRIWAASLPRLPEQTLDTAPNDTVHSEILPPPCSTSRLPIFFQPVKEVTCSWLFGISHSASEGPSHASRKEQQAFTCGGGSEKRDTNIAGGLIGSFVLNSPG